MNKYPGEIARFKMMRDGVELEYVEVRGKTANQLYVARAPFDRLYVDGFVNHTTFIQYPSNYDEGIVPLLTKLHAEYDTVLKQYLEHKEKRNASRHVSIHCNHPGRDTGNIFAVDNTLGKETLNLNIPTIDILAPAVGMAAVNTPPPNQDAAGFTPSYYAMFGKPSANPSEAIQAYEEQEGRSKLEGPCSSVQSNNPDRG